MIRSFGIDIHLTTPESKIMVHPTSIKIMPTPPRRFLSHGGMNVSPFSTTQAQPICKSGLG